MSAQNNINYNTVRTESEKITYLETTTPQQTFAIGQELGRKAAAGEIYTLTGDLGVGKTVFTQGIAAGLGIVEPVNSPTFTIVQIYEVWWAATIR